MRTAVVLPAPFGPSSPSTLPFGALRSIPSSARTLPKDFSRRSASIAAGSAIAPHFSKRDSRRSLRTRPPVCSSGQ